MDVSFATASAPGHRNEDLIVASEDFLIVLDGVTSPPHVPTGCIHDPVWLVRTLGSALTDQLSRRDVPGLTDVLAEAITAVCDRHESTCDLSHPDSPSSTVVLLRERADHLDYLVLCDSTLIFLDTAGEIDRVVMDDRTSAMHVLTRQAVAEKRNRDGGFWVASTDPAAAGQAFTGSIPRARIGSVFACTDGVSRLVHHFGYTWRQVIDIAAGASVRDVLRAVRRAEAMGPPPGVSKQHDDATAAFCRLSAQAPQASMARSSG